ncbi:hypothetical protein G9A89_022738 [Geosiphon pyriformis]|nr:hypothetical protein G9A89_022738 [Geosiphon pyriformis]
MKWECVQVYYLRKPKNTLNEPPLVPYKYPLIGHTYEIRDDCEGFLRRCREKYGDIYNIYQYGEVYTIAGKDCTHEFLANKHANFLDAIEMIFPLTKILGTDKPKNREASIKLIRDQVNPLIPKTIEKFQERAKIAFEKHLGLSEEPKTVYSLDKKIREIVSFSGAFLVFGEELSYDTELISSCAGFTNDIFEFFNIPRTLAFIHPWLHRQKVEWKIRVGENPAERNRAKLIKKLPKIVENRIKEMREQGDKYNPPFDFVQKILDDNVAGEKENIDYNLMAILIYSIIFVSIAGTSVKLSDAIIDYANETDYQKELQEEQEKIAQEYGADKFITIPQLEKMVKLQSFIKESIRYNEEFLGLPKVNLSSSPITLSNGYQIPPKRTVFCDLLSVKESEEYHGSDPTKFDPRRYLNKNSSTTLVSRTYLPFGLGRNACPGRFLAMTYVKILLSMIIRNYKVSFASGAKPKKTVFEGRFIPSSDGVIFEKR